MSNNQIILLNYSGEFQSKNEGTKLNQKIQANSSILNNSVVLFLMFIYVICLPRALGIALPCPALGVITSLLRNARIM